MQCLFQLSPCLLYILVKCDRLTFICDQKNRHRAEQNVASSSGNMLLFFFLCEIYSVSPYVSTPDPFEACFKKKKKKKKPSRSFHCSFCPLFCRAEEGQGSVLREVQQNRNKQTNKKMNTFFFFFSAGLISFFGSCGTFMSLCAHIDESWWNFLANNNNNNNKQYVNSHQ